MDQANQSPQPLFSDQSGSALLRLPTELRLLIWEHVFPSGGYLPMATNIKTGEWSILRRSKHGTNSDWIRHYEPLRRHGYQLERMRPVGGMFPHGDPSTLATLALVCRTIHAEVIPILYGGSIFGINHDWQLSAFLQHISPRCARHMRHIFVAVRLYGNEHSPEWAAACATLLRLPELKTVDFDIIPRMLPPHPPDDELMASILERLASFEGQSPRSGVWSFRVFSVEEWRVVFEERGIPFIVKGANDPRGGLIKRG